MSDLLTLLNSLAEEFKGQIKRDSEYYFLVDLGKASEVLGYEKLAQEYVGKRAVIPVVPQKGQYGFEVSGSDFEPRVQLSSGIVVPKEVAQQAGLSGTPYVPYDSMVLLGRR